ncbi:MAG: response regulator [Phycisphaerales bacterium]|jgi:CheY-like chemotaxis protein
MDTSKFLVLFLVEDDPGDQKLVKNALSAQEAPIELRIVGSGEEALKYLTHNDNGAEENPRPNLILLDLNMPGMGGKEFLRCIKANENLNNIPVVVLTTSDSETDIEDCYKLHAAGYIQKPGSIEEFKKIMKETIEYWSATALL